MTPANASPGRAHRVLIFGNSGAGKSTLARALVHRDDRAHLDLDTIAWKPTEGSNAPERTPLDAAARTIDAFASEHDAWVIEGCYADLLALLTDRADAMLYLNPPLEACVAHARARPFEPHKYPSKQAQDANLPMLLEWIRAYETRDDAAFSADAHRRLFVAFDGRKAELRTPTDPQGALPAL